MEVRNYEIERFYNKDREKDVKYTFYDRIPPSLVILIREILTHQKRL
jgi:hypothetical protein